MKIGQEQAALLSFCDKVLKMVPEGMTADEWSKRVKERWLKKDEKSIDSNKKKG